jgi:hypothetical protein
VNREGGGGDLRGLGQLSLNLARGATKCLLKRLSHIDIAARRRLGIAVLALAMPALGASQAEAQPRISGGPHETHEKKSNRAATTATSPLLAVVSIARQRIQVYGGTGRVAQAPVSTGMAGHRTPTGVFSVLQKRRHHRSNIYSNAPMPYMQRLTWSGIALHAGVLPGYPASHGCIRLPHSFAADLWDMTKVGTRVVVVPDDAPAVFLEDSRLPAPRLIPMLDEQPGSMVGSMAPGPTLASATGQRAVDAQDEMHPPGRPRLTPWQRANAVRIAAAEQLAATAKAVRLMSDAAAAKSAEARKALTALQRAELGLAAAERRRDALVRTAASRLPVADRLVQLRLTAEDSLGEAQRTADEARLIEAALSQEAFEAAAAAVEAEEARLEAATALKLAERSVEPISILVSRKSGRVYVRQAWEPVHEAPVRFVDGGLPLGTHVYLATGVAADGAALNWLSVSLPAPAPRPQGPRDRRGEASQSKTAPSRTQETAPSALARFVLPEATQRFIADRLWAGATLIVSEHGISGETGVGTDFIVLTR